MTKHTPISCSFCTRTDHLTVWKPAENGFAATMVCPRCEDEMLERQLAGDGKPWFQGYFTTPGSNLRVYEGDGLSNRLVATFERPEDAAAAVLAHNGVGA